MAYSMILKTPYYNTKYVLLPIPVDLYIDESNVSYYESPVPSYREEDRYNKSASYETSWSYDEHSGVLKTFTYTLKEVNENTVILSFVYEFIRETIISIIIITLALIVSYVSIIEIFPRLKKALKKEKIKSNGI
jgi:hypothetical protein